MTAIISHRPASILGIHNFSRAECSSSETVVLPQLRLNSTPVFYIRILLQYSTI